jgi:hypothetical protein
MWQINKPEHAFTKSLSMGSGSKAGWQGLGAAGRCALTVEWKSVIVVSKTKYRSKHCSQQNLGWALLRSKRRTI